ncbi:MAG: hypothetical protein AB8C13_10255 [Phycisphaerales bacterium]
MSLQPGIQSRISATLTGSVQYIRVHPPSYFYEPTSILLIYGPQYKARPLKDNHTREPPLDDTKQNTKHLIRPDAPDRR